MEEALEATGRALEAPPGTELRLDRLQMGQHLPKSCSTIATLRCWLACENPLRLGGWRHESGPASGVVMQCVTDIVQADRMRDKMIQNPNDFT